MKEVKLSKKHQIVLPGEARKALSLKAGDHLLVVVKGDLVMLMPKPQNYTKALAGRGKGLYGKSEAYLKKERESWNDRKTGKIPGPT